MAVREVVAERLATHDLSSIATSFDGNNVFPSVDYKPMDEQVDARAKCEKVAAMIKRRYKEATIKVTARDGDLYLKIGSGTLPGDALACDLFRWTYTPIIEKWLELLQVEPNGDMQSFVNLTFRRCNSTNNSGAGFMMCIAFSPKKR